MVDETQAVADRYGRRQQTVEPLRYSLLRPENLQMVQERQRAILRAFVRAGIRDPAMIRVAEVGAGTDGNVLELLRAGFVAENLTALELLPDRAAHARRVLPAGVQVVVGDAAEARIEPGTLDVVYQAVVFSSILDDSFQESLAIRMWSWLKPGGAVLWYDFTYDNPHNRDVRGVSLRRVRQLFPGAQISSWRITLAPPIARRVVRIHPSLDTVCNTLPFLRTHLLCWIEKR